MADGKIVIDTSLDNSGIERDLKEIKKESQKAGDSVKDYAEEFDNASKKSDQSRRDVEKDLDSVKGSLVDVKNAIIAGFSFDFITSAVSDVLDSTNELRGDLSLLEQNAVNASVSLDVTSEAFKRLNTLSGEADSSVEAVSNLLAAGIPENRMLDAVEGLSNAVVMFPDTMKIESLADSLQETLATGEATGQFGELLDRLGIGAENFSENLSLMKDESQRLDYALGVLNSGNLKGLYDGWAEANPELVAGRDASMDLQESMADLAEKIQPVVTFATELAAGITGFVAHNVDVENLFEIIASGTAAVLTVKTYETILGIMDAFEKLGSAALFAKTQTALMYAGIGLVAYAGIQLAQAWGDMTPLEKAVGLLGLLAAAAFTAAIAVGAFQSAATLGIAAVAIAAGIAAVLLAVNSAQGRAESQMRTLESQMSQSSSLGGAVPQLATGAVIPPNRRFMAVLGDQRNGTNLEAPEGLIRKIVREESGGVGGTLRVSPAPGLTRYLKYELEVDGQRAGPSAVEGVRR